MRVGSVVPEKVGSLQDTHIEKNGANGVFDHLAMGIILFDEKGTIILKNKTAQAILADNDGLTVKDHNLTAFDRFENMELQNLIRMALGIKKVGNPESGGQMLVMRRSCRRPYMVFVSPLKSNPISIESKKATVAIYITDPERRFATAEDILRRLYRLTISEARLAALLVEGKNVEEASEKLEITTNTTRTHLKSIYQKTDTRGQSDLIRLVMSGPAAIRINQ